MTHVFRAGEVVQFWDDFQQRWRQSTIARIDTRGTPTMYFVSGSWVPLSRICPMPASESIAAARAEGRREMLWLMAVGARVRVWQHLDRGSKQAYFARAMCADAANEVGHVSTAALQALAAMGDERAREMLR